MMCLHVTSEASQVVKKEPAECANWSGDCRVVLCGCPAPLLEDILLLPGGKERRGGC